VTYTNGRTVAFEIQLSNTFQTEISDRSLHYRREGVGLIWVLLGHELQSGDLPQSFRDVILRHRDNAFVLDQAAIETSLAARRLMLTCFLRKSDGSFGDERQVAVNDLTFPETGWPYYEDRVTPSLLARGEAVRAPWKVALQARTDFSYSELTTPAFIAANSDLCARVPGLALWQHQNLDRWQFAHFIAVMFSTLRYAAGRSRTTLPDSRTSRRCSTASCRDTPSCPSRRFFKRCSPEPRQAPCSRAPSACTSEGHSSWARAI
jgi:hypothetical protein